MSNVTIAEISMEKCFLNMPCEILFEIFGGLTKGKLIEISRLCSKFRDIVGDTRLWKDVYIKYEPYKPSPASYYKIFAFEELYSEPWPVKVVDLSQANISSPVCSQTHQVTKVKKLRLSSIKAKEETIRAILTKYQCTELYLDSKNIGIAPETFSKQPALETLSLKYPTNQHGDYLMDFLRNEFRLVHWLPSVLRKCKNLKSLDSCYHITFTELDSRRFIKSLPTSLEKLFLANVSTKDFFFELLAETTPNLTDLGLSVGNLKCPSLLKLKFLEALHFTTYDNSAISDLHTYLIKFPALKAVCICHRLFSNGSEANHKKLLGSMLEPYGIIVALNERPGWAYPRDGNLWEVSKAI